MAIQHLRSPPLNIVAADNFSDSSLGSSYALQQAARVARRVRHSRLHVVTVIEGESSPAETRRIGSQIHRYVEEVAAVVGGLEGQLITVHVRCGRAATELLQFAANVRADLLVVGYRRVPRTEQFLFGSVVDRVMLAAPCPVFVAGPMPKRVDIVREPEVESDCAACLVAREKTGGAAWWCSRHAEYQAQASAYSGRRVPPRVHAH